jgi:two-component sensor histidine kinase
LEAGDQKREGERWIERLPFGADAPLRSLAIALGIVVAALLLRVLALPLIPTGSPFITFFPAVLLIAFLFGVRLGVFATLVSIALALLFFMSNPWSVGFLVTTFPSTIAFAVLVTLNLTIFHWMQQANAHLHAERERSAALAETRELLFRELQHRVSNNIQVAAGLLALQKKHVADEAARGALDEAARRLGVIGRISRQLYEAEGVTRNLHAFLEPLCADVIDAGGKPVTLRLTGGEGMILPSDAAIPLALIVAEAVANAIEHGFAGREQGTIDVVLVREGADIRVEIRDDGHGLVEGFDLKASASLGLSLAAMLAGQLGGRFELENLSPGACARLTIPA